MATTDKINHRLEIRRGKSLGLFSPSSLVGTLMRAAFFIAVIPILAPAQTREQIAAMQAQIATQQTQKNDDLPVTERDALQAQLDAISQRDALQNQPKTGEAGVNPGQQDVFSAVDQSQPQQEPQSARSEASPAPAPAKPQAENEQATASQNQAHRSPSESARPQRIHRTRETKTQNSAASTKPTPFLSQLWNQWNRLWQRRKANP